MKTAFIADVHGNLEALHAVCSAILQEQVDLVVSLGDTVGYGANPNECIQELRHLECHGLVGNHDLVAVNKLSSGRFNPAAQAALAWTSSRLTAESRSFLCGLPLQLEISGSTAVHASPLKPAAWAYIGSSSEAAEAFGAFKGRICFCGHTHRPGVFIEHADRSVVSAEACRVELDPRCRYLINCGSVGQPRDGDSRACYGIFDSTANTYRLERRAYAVQLAQEKILQAGLPPFLAERLSAGR